MRGKESWQPPQSRFAGITPAYAGKRSACSPPSPHSRDHPRVCGEKHVFAGRYIYFVGSPPRMRGKGPGPSVRHVQHRITPAYAGKSSELMQKFGMSGDHPRVCREKAQHRATGCSAAGSPPRMRGKATQIFRNLHCFGITPAYAGKRFLWFLPAVRRWDHPRVYGEKGVEDVQDSPNLGSPPRVRGKAMVCFFGLVSSRITPAYAGKRTFVPLVKSTA